MLSDTIVTVRSAFSSVRRPLAMLFAVLIFLCIAYPVMHGGFHSDQDVKLYARYAQAAQATPATLPLEYPPLVVLLFIVPLLIAPNAYPLAFAAFAALAVWVTLIVVDYCSGQGWWLWLMLVLGSWGTIFGRYDIFVVCVTVLAFVSAHRQRWLLAQALLVLGVGLKLYPVVLMPLVVLWQWQYEGKQRWVPVLWAGGLLALVIGGMWAVAPAQLAAMLQYHGDRPLEFEAIGASIAWLVGPTRYTHAFGSLNRESAYSPIIILLLTALNVGSLLVLYISCLRRQTSPAVSWALCLLMSIATSKVFSTQYLLWPLPFVAIALHESVSGREGNRREYTILWLLICLLTSLVFPVGQALLQPDLLMVPVTARNILWIIAVLTLAGAGPLRSWSERIWSIVRSEGRYWSARKAGLIMLLISLGLVTSFVLHLHIGQVRQISIGSDLPSIVGFRDVHEVELDVAGAYRWTEPVTSLVLHGVVSPVRPWVTLQVGSAPAVVAAVRLVQIEFDGRPIIVLPVQVAQRRYHFMLPAGGLDGEVIVRLTSQTFSIAPDPRQLGIRLEQVMLAWPAGFWGLPSWQSFLVVCVIELVAFALLRRQVRSSYGLWLCAGGVLLLVGWMAGYELFVEPTWVFRIVVSSLMIAGLCCGIVLLVGGIRLERGESNPQLHVPPQTTPDLYNQSQALDKKLRD